MPGSIYHIDYPVNVEGVFYYPTKGWGCDLWPWLDDNVVEEGCSHSSPFFCHFPGSGWWKWAWKEVRNMAFYWFYGPLLALWAADYGCRLQRHTLTLLLYSIQPPPFFFGWVLLFKRIQLFLTDRWLHRFWPFPVGGQTERGEMIKPACLCAFQVFPAHFHLHFLSPTRGPTVIRV